jgi:hypothetical protein
MDMTAQELIQQIVTYHPCFEAGLSRQLSWWAKGSFGGRGEWNYLGLIYAPIEELEQVLVELIKENEGIDFRWNEQLIKA